MPINNLRAFQDVIVNCQLKSNAVEEVDSATVIITDNNAYVGVV